MTTKWSQVVCPVRNLTSARETNDNDVHNCESNNITVQSKSNSRGISVDRSTSVQFVFLKLQNNFTAKLNTNVSYGLLFQQFLGTFSDIFIISVKADTRNFSQNYQQFFY